MTKKQGQRFLSRVKKLLLDLGAEQSDDRFMLKTRAGRLSLRPTEDTVFTRFDDPKAARQFVGCNPFSGKWNHHYFNGWTAETALDDFSCQLQRVLR